MAALISLMNLIDDTIKNHPGLQFVWTKIKLNLSLNPLSSCWNFFNTMYVSPLDDEDKADPLEMRIVEAAYAAEDIIESYIVHLIQLNTPTVENDQATYDSSEEVSCIKIYIK